MYFSPNFRTAFLLTSLALQMSAQATGMLPDTPLLVISEADGTAQMGLRNTDDQPLLLHTTIVDIEEDKNAPAVYAIPPVTRVEANGRQIVRFILEKGASALTVQHLKRVRFEGIPGVGPVKGNSVKLTVRQDLPVVISPKGLEQDPAPWKHVLWRLDGKKITISNPSPFVARIHQELVLLPSLERAKLLPRPFVLPGDNFEVELPSSVDASKLTGLRITPGSPYGFVTPAYDIVLSQTPSAP